MDSTVLARRSHQNMVAAFSSLPPHQPNGFVDELGGVVVAATGSPIPFFNQVLPLEEHVDRDALRAAIAVMRQAGLRSVVHLRDGVDAQLLPVVAALGFIQEESQPAMNLTDLPSHEMPDGFAVTRVADRCGFDAHLMTAAANAGASTDLYATWLGATIVDDPQVSLFVGYANGTPVATSLSVRTGDVVGVYNVGTAPAARRRGYGWAMTLAAIVDGAAAGCSLATLQASVMGYPIYAEHGFQTLFRYRAFRDAMAGRASADLVAHTAL
ncbi:MAG TPA: GNAT family N-acetyltransferase [Candidatus Dormibacteraeota bacterium]